MATNVVFNINFSEGLYNLLFNHGSVYQPGYKIPENFIIGSWLHYSVP